jgi:hypothetical protein
MLCACSIDTYICGKDTVKEIIANCGLYEIINHFCML